MLRLVPIQKQQQQTLGALMQRYVSEFGATRNTARAKMYDLQKFYAFLSAETGREPRLSDITVARAGQFSEWLTHACNYQASTVCRVMATVKHLSRVLAEWEPEWRDPLTRYRLPKPPTKQPKDLTDEDRTALRMNVGTMMHWSPLQRARASVLVELLASQGLRCSEARDLRVSSVDLEARVLRSVRRRKSRSEDELPMSPRTEAALLRGYLELREEALMQHDARYASRPERLRRSYPLLVSTANAQPGVPESYRLHERSIGRTIKALLPDAHPHLLRHAFAHEFLKLAAQRKDDKNALLLTSKALGHSDVRTTMRYVDHTWADLSEAFKCLK